MNNSNDVGEKLLGLISGLKKFHYNNVTKVKVGLEIWA